MKNKITVLIPIIFLILSVLSGCDARNDSEDDDFTCPRIDDDTDDDETSDDDDNNDDNDDNDDDSGPLYPPDEGITVGDLFVQMVAGGAPGHDGTAIVIDENDGTSIAAVSGRILYVYSIDSENKWTRERVAYFASEPDMAIDSFGFLHVAYKSRHPDALGYATNISGQWETQTVDIAGGGGFSPAIAIGPDDAPWIGYLDSTATELKVASYQEKGWDIQTMINGTATIICPSIIVDRDNHGHISLTFTQGGVYAVYYINNTLGSWDMELLAVDSRRSDITMDPDGFIHVTHLNIDWWGRMSHSTNRTGAWVTEQFDSSSSFIGDSAILVDPEGIVHIAYGNVQEGLAIADNSQGEFLPKVISDAFGEGWYPSISEGQNGKIGIAYFNENDATLKITTRETNGWITKTVDSGQPVTGRIAQSAEGTTAATTGQNGLSFWKREDGLWYETVIESGKSFSALSFSIDSNNHGHIACKDGQTGHLVYATDAAGSWNLTSIYPANEVADMTSIRAEIPGVLRIAYFDVLTGELKITSKTGKSWNTEIVETVGAGHCVALVIDGQGDSHIAYEGAGHIRYATDKSGSWVIEQLDDAPYTGEYCSIALAADQSLRISYSDRNDNDLQFASNESGTWELSIIGAPGEAGTHNSLVLDTNDAAHILYRSDTDATLKYADNTAGGFSITTVDGFGNVGTDVSMILDESDDTLKVLYSGEYALWYAELPKGFQAE